MLCLFVCKGVASPCVTQPASCSVSIAGTQLAYNVRTVYSLAQGLLLHFEKIRD